MSIANLFQPNSDNLYCGALNCNSITAASIANPVFSGNVSLNNPTATNIIQTVANQKLYIETTGAGNIYLQPGSGGSSVLRGTNVISEANIAIELANNQLTLGTSGTTWSTINCPPAAAARTYTIPDVGNNANFMFGGAGSTTYAQATSNTTAVAVSTQFAKIAMFGPLPAVAANTPVSFTVNCPLITATSQIMFFLSGQGAVSATSFIPLTISISGQAAGSVVVNVYNNDTVHASATNPLVNLIIC
jgi:hypothetical protein